MSSATISTDSLDDREEATRASKRTAPRPAAVAFEEDEALRDDPLILNEIEDVDTRETFIPVTRAALIDRLTRPQAWRAGEGQAARRLFRYLSYWRQQQYNSAVMQLDQSYEPFNPDSDLLMTRQYTGREKETMQQRVVGGMRQILKQANYTEIDPSDVELIMNTESYYGLDFHIDLEAFEELAIFFRGASTRKDQRRMVRKFFRKEEFDVPIFQRLFILFKLKSEEQRVDEFMRTRGLDRAKAQKAVKKLRGMVPAGVSSDNIYMKLFKNMPRADVEMIFPNTRVKFRMFDKIKLGVTGSGAIGMGLFGTVGKLVAGGTAALNPIALTGALFALGGVLFRQVMSFFNTHQKYMVVMAQNLYFHSLADNRGVLILLADRAAEEDVKEEMLLYSVLAKETVRREDLEAVDRAIEQYIMQTFGLNVDFDLHDALERLMADGLVKETPGGTLTTMPPGAAAEHIDAMWDVFLDHLPDHIDAEEEGEEFEGVPGGATSGPAP
jgi:hypothetical protein